jgi:hypothetical protein
VRQVVILVVALILLAGCASPEGSVSPTPAESESPCLDGVSTYIVDSWESDEIYVAYSFPASYSGHLVVLDNGSILASQYLNYTMSGVADGNLIRLPEPLSGTHTIRVVEYHDNRSDGEFDRSVDQPCRVNGTLRATENVTMNFTVETISPDTPT